MQAWELYVLCLTFLLLNHLAKQVDYDLFVIFYRFNWLENIEFENTVNWDHKAKREYSGKYVWDLKIICFDRSPCYTG
jgi:hypothetical protein